MSLRRLLQSSLYVLALIAATPAFASSITLKQQSSTMMYGDWMLTQPNATTMVSHNQEQNRTISSAPAGTYALKITPPAGATTTICLKENGVVTKSITGHALSFTVTQDASLEIQMIYTYQGTVIVESIPSGSPFELHGPQGIRHTGVTPMTIRELPPYYYSVNFGLKEGCSLPHPIKRELPESGTLTFVGEYKCGAALSSEGVRSSSTSSIAPAHTARVVQSVSTQELLAGSTAMLTTGFVNSGTATLHDLTFTVQFDPAVVSITQLPATAVVEGNVIIWRIGSLYAGQRWNDTVSISLVSGVKAGTKSLLTARVSGAELAAQDSDALYATSVIGSAALPATGGSLDVILGLMSLLVPAPLMMMKRKG